MVANVDFLDQEAGAEMTDIQMNFESLAGVTTNDRRQKEM